MLRLYDLKHQGAPAASVDVASSLEPDDPEETEADIEGVAQLGDRLYWVGSHSRSKKGKERKIRQRLFATTIEHTDGGVELRPVGKPYKQFLDDLVDAHALAGFDLASAAGKSREVEGGLNIEGLAATPDGQLLLGFRNPIPGGQALIVRLANAVALINGTADRADVSVGGLLDLQGRGIRALEYVPDLNLYFILAGPFNDEGTFALYDGPTMPSSPAAPLSLDMGSLKPEEMIIVQDASGNPVMHLFSDDGTDNLR